MQNLKNGFIELDDYSFEFSSETTIKMIEMSDLKEQIHHKGNNVNGYKTITFKPLKIDNLNFIINILFNVNFKIMRITMSSVDEDDIKNIEQMYSWNDYPFHKEKLKIILHNNFLEAKLGNSNRIRTGFFRLKTEFVEYKYDWGVIGSYKDLHNQTSNIVISYTLV